MSFDLKIKDGDLSINNGDLDIVEKEEKLVQDILKIVTTQLGANPFFPWYGSAISKALIGTSLESSFISAIATNELRVSLERLQQLQSEQQSKTSQEVTPEEQIASIQGVNVDQNSIDPRFYSIVLTVLNKNFRRTTTTLNVKL